jgi:hypothetical protein
MDNKAAGSLDLWEHRHHHAADDLGGKDTEMSFFGTQPRDSQIADWTIRLYKATSSFRNHGTKPNMRTWENAFAHMRRDYTNEDIDKVLTWYCANVGKQFVPRVASAVTFRARFEAIARAMENDLESAVEVDEVSVGMADKAMQEGKFPPEVAKALPVLVQRSRDNWQAFVGKIVERIGTLSERDQDFLDRVILMHGPVFVRSWIDLIGRQVGGLSHYTGPVLGLAFKPDSAAFKTSFWSDWSREWCGNAAAFDKLLEELLR